MFGSLAHEYIQFLLFAIFIISSDVLIFFWLDVTVRVARRSDPFEMDSLHWSKTKFVLGAGVVLAGVVTLVNAPIAVIFGMGVGVPTSVPLVYQILGLGQCVSLALTAAILFLISTVRSKDRRLQKHLKWFGLFPAKIFVTLLQLGIFGYFLSGAVPNSGEK